MLWFARPYLAFLKYIGFSKIKRSFKVSITGLGKAGFSILSTLSSLIPIFSTPLIPLIIHPRRNLNQPLVLQIRSTLARPFWGVLPSLLVEGFLLFAPCFVSSGFFVFPQAGFNDIFVNWRHVVPSVPLLSPGQNLLSLWFNSRNYQVSRCPVIFQKIHVSFWLFLNLLIPLSIKPLRPCIYIFSERV